MKSFQFFKIFGDEFFEKENKRMIDYWGNIKKTLDDTHHFELDKSIVPILKATKSNKTELPYTNLFMSGEIRIKKRLYGGIFIYNATLIGGEEENEKTILYMANYLKEDEKAKYKGDKKIIKFEFGDLNKGTGDKELINFIYSFSNFIHEPEVEVRTKQVNPKNNKRRTERGLQTLPEEKIIKITGNLKKYISEFNEGMGFGYKYRFYVRGHFMYFRDTKKYKNIYQIPEDKLKEKGYTKVKGIIRRWKKPFIKGKGLLINKSYIVTKK